MLAVLLILLFYFGSTWLVVRSNDSTYCGNIYVNGIELNSYTKQAGIDTMQELVDEYLSTSYTLSYADQSWSFTAADFGGSIDLSSVMDRAWNIGHVGGLFARRSAIGDLKSNPVYLTAELNYDEALLDDFVDSIYDDLFVAPVDAEVTITIDRPYLTTQSSPGRKLDRDATREQICSLIETGSGETQLSVVDVEPAVSSDEAAGGLEIIVQFSTDVSFRGYDSRFNVRKALNYFNGFTVYPGDMVDFNAIVGSRTEQLGWREAPEYAGSTTTTGFGGGVCQASTTLYDAVLKAGMDIIERNRHTMTVSYVDPSLDAAVSEDGNGKNMIFQNNTEHAIYIFTEVGKETATVTIYGNKPEYRYELYSNVISQESVALRNSYIDDTDGKYCTYTTETALYKEGRPACTSEGWLIAYDWDTGEEVSRRQLSYDTYLSGTNIYWRGVQEPVGIITEY